jgi:coatomer subunit gamma
MCLLLSLSCNVVTLINQVDPASGEVEDDGVEDEYQLEDLEVIYADYMLKVPVSNFRNAWESMDPESERVDEYGLGARESLAEAVNAVTSILGMHPCEVLSLSLSHTHTHTHTHHEHTHAHYVDMHVECECIFSG